MVRFNQPLFRIFPGIWYDKILKTNLWCIDASPLRTRLRPQSVWNIQGPIRFRQILHNFQGMCLWEPDQTLVSSGTGHEKINLQPGLFVFKLAIIISFLAVFALVFLPFAFLITFCFSFDFLSFVSSTFLFF